MSVSVTYASTLSVVEAYADTFVDSADNTVKFSGLNSSGTYTGASNYPCTKVAAYEKAMSAGAATIDLTALVGIANSAVSGSGLKVQFVKFKNKATNANAITIGEGASNGYELFGNAWSIILQPGQEILACLAEQAPDIGSGAKNIDIAGTGAQVLQVEFVMG